MFFPTFCFASAGVIESSLSAALTLAGFGICAALVASATAGAGVGVSGAGPANVARGSG